MTDSDSIEARRDEIRLNRIRGRGLNGVRQALVTAGDVPVASFFLRVVRPRLIIVPLAVAGIALSGCGGTPAVSRSKLEHEVAQRLSAIAHRAPPNISCPSDLPGKVGATVHCVLSVTGDPRRADVLVRVTSVSGSHLHFHMQVGSTPLPAGSG